MRAHNSQKNGWGDKASSGFHARWHRQPVQFTGDTKPPLGTVHAVLIPAAHLPRGAGAATVQMRTSASAGGPLSTFPCPPSDLCCALKKSLDVFPFLTNADIAPSAYQNPTAPSHKHRRAKASGSLLTVSAGEAGTRRPEQTEQAEGGNY